MPDGWQPSWQELISERARACEIENRLLCCLVVPDKLATYSDLFPGSDDQVNARRPIVQLLNAGLPLLYPCDALRDARVRGDTYLMTDSHLTSLGNRVIAEKVIESVGCQPSLLDCVSTTETLELISGDLGSHFTPAIVEIVRRIGTPSAASITVDNWPEISSLGGHIGTRRIFRREDAPDGRIVVIFGDSYGFGDESYHGLAWFLAQVFREVHFIWTPCGWDPDYIEKARASIVICETAERFLVRVPRARIDSQLLAEETLRRRTALDPARVFED